MDRNDLERLSRIRSLLGRLQRTMVLVTAVLIWQHEKPITTVN